ncbi:MAG: TonB-dependent receptor [Ignavibacteriales bacterium]|nr:TonB-dependent receptor [Ignavibacteriales bacterium]
MRKVVTIVIVCLLSFKVYAGDSGKIAGRVVDALTKEPLAGANIIVVGTTRGTVVDLEGRYAILNLSPGTYSIRASALGYQAMEIANLRVSIDLTTVADFILTESAITTQAVVVMAERPLVQKDMTSSTAIVDSKKIEALPITSFQDVLALQAGVVAGHFRGGRSGEVTYLLDGIPMTDPNTGSAVINVNTNSIQEMQLVTGAFNAEYGNAMSGIVNIATKNGGNELKGNITAYSGGYVTSHSDIFTGLQKVNPFNSQWLEVSLNGPIVSNDLFFYIDARHYYTAGNLFGIRKFNTFDITNARAASTADWNIQETGDGATVPMAPYLEMYLQAKLTYKPSATFQISYNCILNNNRGKDYNFAFKYNPDGELSNFTKGYVNNLNITHTINSKTYYNVGASYFFHDYREYLDQSPFSLSDLFNRRDPFNQDYVNTALLQAPEGTFVTGGTIMAHNVNNTGSYLVKFDITSQATDNHMIKGGLEFNKYQLFLHYINLQMPQGDINRDPVLDGKPFLEGPVVIPSIESLNNQLYLHRPMQFSAYLQDKMEFKSLIVNFGVRFDWFHPDGQVLANPADPNVYWPLQPQYQDSVIAPGVTDTTLLHQIAVQKRMGFWYKNATDKYQFSPRLGVSFPITDQGIIHFSYGLFFQMPSFYQLYQSPGYKLRIAGSTFLGTIGNPDLNPEQTTKGELGLQQQLSDDISIDITGYFNDIRNLSGTLNEIIYVYGGAAEYSKFVNTDFGFVRGLVISIDKRLANSWAATLDYTFQIAKGNASDPNAAVNLLNSGVLPETQLIPLDWDQLQTLNVTLSYANPSNWGASFNFRYGSGTPYTPQGLTNVGQLVYNSAIKPATYNLDARIYKDFKIGGKTLSLFLRIINLLDTKNPLNVYTDTGLPNVSLAEEQIISTNPSQRISTVHDWYTNPTFYSEPRRVEFGTTISF